MVIGLKSDTSVKDKLFIPAELPILPLRGTVAYPDLVIPLVVGREKSIRLIDEAMAKDRMIGILTQRNADIEEPDAEDLYSVGTVASIGLVMVSPNMTYPKVIAADAQKVVKKLEENDIKISRRTVTKYREAESIPSSRQRRAY